MFERLELEKLVFGNLTVKLKSLISFSLITFGMSCVFCQAQEPAYNTDTQSSFGNQQNTQSSFNQDSAQFTKSTSFGGVEVSFFQNDLLNNSSSVNPASYSESSELKFRPEISLFTSTPPSKIAVNSAASLNSNLRGESNRYKNTIPAVYRLTLKGYSIMEYSNNIAETWSLDKVKDKTISKPMIMFSITKQF